MWFYVICAVAIVLFIVDIALLAAIVKMSKKLKSAETSSKKEPDQTPVKKQVSQTEDEKEILAVNDRFEDKKPVAKEEPAPAKEAVKEPVKAEQAKEEPVKVEPVKEEPKEEPAPVEEPKEEEPVEEKPAEPVKAEEKPAKKEKKEPKKTEKKKPAEKKEEPAPVKEEPVKEEPKEEPAPVEEDKKDKAKVTGKIEICNSDLGGFTYLLRANNGQLLYESKTYKSTASCIEGAKSFVEAVKADMFKVRVDKFNRYKFNLKSPTSNNIIYVGESFDNERSCQSNIDSVRRFAGVSDIVDMTEADFKANFTPYEISDEVKDKVKNNNGVVGKWLIEREDNGSKNAPYVFLLYASNGQLLYESRDYSSYSSCKSGLETFRTAIQEGKFIIDPDKAGRYKFILRNTTKNSLMEYIGQSYSTVRACAEGIDSIYRFALVSPTDNL